MGAAPLLYLDSAKLDEVRAAHATGKLAGITINPSLALQATGEYGDYAEHVRQLSGIVGPEVHKSYQVVGRSRREMLDAAYKLRDAFERYGGFGVKVPVFTADVTNKHLSRDGLDTVRQLSQEGFTVNVTTVQRPEQAVLAAYCGARLVSPFLGRTDDHIHTLMGDRMDREFRKQSYFDFRGKRGFADGYGNVSGVHMMARAAYALHVMNEIGFKHDARILAASSRNVQQCTEAAEFWADIITSPYDIFGFTARDSFAWSGRAELRDFDRAWPGFLTDITGEKIKGWISTYTEPTTQGDEQLFMLLFHPETVKGFRNFEDDGNRLASFKELVSEK